MNRIRLFRFAIAATLLSTASIQAQDAEKLHDLKPLTPEILSHIAESVRLSAGNNYPLGGLYNPAHRLVLSSEIFLLPPLPPELAFLGAPKDQTKSLRPVQSPAKLFDQLYYFGDSYTGAVVLVTSAGIIQWDTMDNDNEAQNIIEAGYKAVSLNPSDIRYIIITHGHSDHYGGASYFQRRYPGVHVLASGADWQLIANTTSRPGSEMPHKDMLVVDNEKLTLGDTTVTLYITPGHTPGAMSSIFTVTDHGAPHVLAMFGGMTIPAHLAPGPRDAGLEEQARQWRRFGTIAQEAGADGVISTHPWADGLVESIKTLQTRKTGEPNPIIRGKKATMII